MRRGAAELLALAQKEASSGKGSNQVTEMGANEKAIQLLALDYKSTGSLACGEQGQTATGNPARKA